MRSRINPGIVIRVWLKRVNTNKDRHPSPDPVITRIAELHGYGESWSLEAAEIRDLLGVGSTEFFRRIYAAESRDHPLISLAAATGTYSQDNIWEFVALIELFCGAEAEERLERAGIFFSHPEQMEILGVFLNQTAAALRLQQVDAEQFSAMLRTFGRFEQARDVYIAEHFPLDELMRGAAAAYCSDRSFAIPRLALANAKRLLEFFFQKHVLQRRSIFAVLIGRLLRQAVAEGYAAETERLRGEQQGAEPGVSGPSSHLDGARKAMDLEGRPLSVPLLKRQYKRLMKIYHPDINPRGLRRCQEITAAYSLLLTYL
jgi:hypothetical protein